MAAKQNDETKRIREASFATERSLNVSDRSRDAAIRRLLRMIAFWRNVSLLIGLCYKRAGPIKRWTE